MPNISLIAVGVVLFITGLLALRTPYPIFGIVALVMGFIIGVGGLFWDRRNVGRGKD